MLRKMIHQSNFYDAINSSSKGLTVVKAFRQGGGSVFSGYLPYYSQGVCAFTVLDYFRAGTQNCLKEWLNHSRDLFTTSQHAARQQYLYMNRDGCASDSLFLATSQQVKEKDLEDDEEKDFISIENNNKNDPGYLERKELYSIADDDHDALEKTAARIYEIYSNFIKKTSDTKLIPLSTYAPCIELTFNVNDGSKHIATHSTGFILEPPGNKKPQHLLFLDPNAGIIKIPLSNKMGIKNLLKFLQNNLYKDYQLNNLTINQKIPFWIKNIDPILNGETKKLEKNIHNGGVNYLHELKQYYKTQKETGKKIDMSSIVILDDDSEDELSESLEKNKDAKSSVREKETVLKKSSEKPESNKKELLYYAFDPIASTISPVNYSKENVKTLKKSR